jgi:hypothetical protein
LPLSVAGAAHRQVSLISALNDRSSRSMAPVRANCAERQRDPRWQDALIARIRIPGWVAGKLFAEIPAVLPGSTSRSRAPWQ